VQAAETRPPNGDPVTPPIAEPRPLEEPAPEADLVEMQAATVDVLGLDAYTRISRPDADTDAQKDDEPRVG
jgi:hypothetical protein